MTIADELEGFTTSNGPVCRGTTLTAALRSDLDEALSSPTQHAVVARWWNATRGDGTMKLSAEWVARHRRKECASCR